MKRVLKLFLFLLLFSFKFTIAGEFEETGDINFISSSFLKLGFQVQNKYVDILNLRGTEDISTNINPNSFGDYYSPTINIKKRNKNGYLFFNLINRNIEVVDTYLSVFSLNVFYNI